MKKLISLSIIAIFTLTSCKPGIIGRLLAMSTAGACPLDMLSPHVLRAA